MVETFQIKMKIFFVSVYTKKSSLYLWRPKISILQNASREKYTSFIQDFTSTRKYFIYPLLELISDFLHIPVLVYIFQVPICWDLYKWLIEVWVQLYTIFQVLNY